ncbi:MAG: TatD family hydrolase [Candidatus Binataceae bacterium]
MIDSHCHLADPKLRGEIDAVIRRAADAGVGTIVAVGAIESLETDRLTVEIAQNNPEVYAIIGVHPHDASDCDRARLKALRELAGSDRVVAIGESGLDFHYMRSPQAEQERSLRAHLELAGELELPIAIHCRGAERRLCEIVNEVGMPKRGGVIHCFSADAAAAREFLQLGFYISFAGIVTFKNAAAVRAAVPIVPDDCVMVETDAPYLAPEPHRGKRNEPAFVIHTVERLAALRHTEPSKMAEITANNTRRLFNLPA